MNSTLYAITSACERCVRRCIAGLRVLLEPWAPESGRKAGFQWLFDPASIGYGDSHVELRETRCNYVIGIDLVP